MGWDTLNISYSSKLHAPQLAPHWHSLTGVVCLHQKPQNTSYDLIPTLQAGYWRQELIKTLSIWLALQLYSAVSLDTNWHFSHPEKLVLQLKHTTMVCCFLCRAAPVSRRVLVGSGLLASGAAAGAAAAKAEQDERKGDVSSNKALSQHCSTAQHDRA